MIILNPSATETDPDSNPNSNPNPTPNPNWNPMPKAITDANPS